MSASPMFTAALAYARSGFPIVPCNENTKKPHSTAVFLNGAKSATLDIERVRDHWYDYPDDNIGLASDGSFVLVDIDPRNGGSLEAAESIGLPMDGYREVTVSGGRRIPLIMPAGMVAVRSAQPVYGVEIKALGAYALAPHSRVDGRWYRPETDRDIWRFGSIPAAWDMLGVLVAQTSTLSSISVTPQDELSAAVLERQMRRSSDYGQGITAILDGDCDWSRYFDTAQDLSESGRDFQLALAASHFLRGHPRRENVIAAILLNHSTKARRSDTSDSYVAYVVTAATGSRDNRDYVRQSSFSNRFVLPSLHLTSHHRPNTVLDAKLLSKKERSSVMDTTILAFAASDTADEFSCAGGWRRLPVQTIGAIFGVDRESVRLRLVALERRGLIRRQAPAKWHDGRWRRDSLVSILSPGRELLTNLWLVVSEFNVGTIILPGES